MRSVAAPATLTKAAPTHRSSRHIDATTDNILPSLIRLQMRLHTACAAAAAAIQKATPTALSGTQLSEWDVGVAHSGMEVKNQQRLQNTVVTV